MADVQANFAAGPTPPASLHLEVNTVTGSTAIVGAASQSIAFDYYTLTSAGGRLNPTGWASLDSQEVDTSGPGAGESWDVQPQPDSHELIELYLRGASTASPDEQISLGHAFDPLVAGQGSPGDLQFKYAPQGSSSLRTATVTYVTPPMSAGDYNDDNVVNAADYTVWRNTLGSTTDLQADGDGNGKIDRDDYLIWKWSYGHVGPGSGATVPEPSSVLLAAIAILARCCAWRQRRS